MKITLLAPLALALFLAPHFAFAQTDTTPLTAPNPRQLLDHLFDSYADKTFAATFDVSLQDGTQQPLAPLKLHLRILHRTEDGDISERLKIVGNIEGEGRTDNFQLLDDGRDTNVTFGDEKGKKGALELLPQFTATLETLVAKYGKMAQFADFSPVSLSMQLKAEGAPAWTLDAKNKDGHTLRAVVDAKTRALISLELSGAYSLHVSDQTFDAPLPELEFNSTQVADFRHANPHSMTLIVPSLLAEDDDDAPTEATAPAKPTPAK